MKKAFLAATVICLVIFSCKKKDKNPPSTNTSTTTTSGTSTTSGTTGGTTTGGTTTGGTTTGGSTGTPTTATTFEGIFTSGENIGKFGSFTYTSTNATAYFSNVPTSVPDPDSGVEVGAVLMNDYALEYDSAGMYSYIDPFSINLSTEVWKVTGDNGIPSFTVTNTQGRPAGVNVSNIPTQISKAAGVTISIGNLTNVKGGSFFLSDGSSNLTGTIILPLVNGNQNVNLTSSQLSSMQTGTTGVIGILLDNSQALNIQGKNFKFTKQMQVINSITINN